MMSYKTGAKRGNKNALKTKWYIIKSHNFTNGKVQYQVSNDVIDLRTEHYDFDSFEDAKECLDNIRMVEKNMAQNKTQADNYFNSLEQENEK